MNTQLVIAALAALAQEHRLAIYRLLVQAGPSGLPAGQISSKLQLAAATTSFHLKELSQVGLLSPCPKGRFIYYSTNFSQMNELIGFLTENCCQGDADQCTPIHSCNTGKHSC